MRGFGLLIFLSVWLLVVSLIKILFCLKAGAGFEPA
jgi:hypothetical protein